MFRGGQGRFRDLRYRYFLMYNGKVTYFLSYDTTVFIKEIVMDKIKAVVGYTLFAYNKVYRK